MTPRLAMTFFLLAHPFSVIFSTPGHAQFSYQFEFVGSPTAGTEYSDGASAGFIRSSLRYGYVLNDARFPEYCPPPPPGLAVGLWHVNATGNHPCSSLAFLGFYQINGELGQMIAWGDGEIQHRNSDPDSNAYQGLFNLGWNDFDVKIGPLCPGKYIMRLYTKEYDWSTDPSRQVGNKAGWYLRDENISTRLTAEEEVSLESACPVSNYLANLYCIDSEKNVAVFPGGAIALDKTYSFVVYLRTFRDSYSPPEEIQGRISPQGKSPIQTLLVRWPEVDGDLLADNGQRQYAYKTDTTYNPLDFWDYTANQWRNKSMAVACSIQSQSGLAQNGLGGLFYAVADVCLDRLNDSTATFIPAAGQGMAFRFIYSPSIGIDASSVLTFNVIDGNRQLVYKETLRAVKQGFDGIVGFPLEGPQLNTIFITWSGRDNQTERAGHLVDPEQGPYRSWVNVETDDDSSKQK